MRPPELTPEQRRAALAKAAEARRVRAEIKELLKTGSLTLPEVLDRAETDELVAGTKVRGDHRLAARSREGQGQAPHGGAGYRFQPAASWARYPATSGAPRPVFLGGT